MGQTRKPWFQGAKLGGNHPGTIGNPPTLAGMALNSSTRASSRLAQRDKLGGGDSI